MTLKPEDLREKVARVIAEALGDDLDHAFTNKSEWNRARGEKGGRYRDINEPMRDDYLAAADAILALLSPADGWRPIETAPKDGTVIDLWIAGDDTLRLDAAHRRFLGQWGKPSVLVHPASEETWLIGPRSPIPAPYVATHWMPLPAAPRPPGGGDG